MAQLPNDRGFTVIDKEEMYRQIVEYSFETTVIHSNHKVLYINQSGADFLGEKKENLIGANVVDLFTESYREYIVERIRRATNEKQVGELIETKIYKCDGSVADIELYCHPVMFGEQEAIQSILRDITQRKETERHLTQMLNEVSTPIVPLLDGIAVLPLVGAINEERSQQLLDLIPAQIEASPLNYLIMDVSGIYKMDDVVVDFLSKINAIFRIMGVEPICTGVRPELAQRLVNVGDDQLTCIRTMGSVKQALNFLISN